MSEEYSAEAASTYRFDDCEVPQGYNPDEAGYRKPPIGQHVMKIDFQNSKVILDKEFKWTDQVTKQQQTYVLSQWQVRLVIADGPHAGASITDFLPMPTPRCAWPAGLANQWANHLKGFGFAPPPNAVVPPGFNIKMLDGAFARVTIVGSRRRNQAGQFEPVMDADGTQKVEVKMFGYSPLTEPPNKAAAADSPIPSSAGQPVGAGVGSAPAAAKEDKDFDL